MAFVADPQAPEVVQVGEAALDDPALASEAGAVSDAALGDDRFDAASPQQPAVLGEVIAAVGQQSIGLAARAADLARYRSSGEVVQQRDQLGDVVAVAAGQWPGDVRWALSYENSLRAA